MLRGVVAMLTAVASLIAWSATTAPVAGAAGLPRCPLSALAKARGPVQISFWESMSPTDANGKTLESLAAKFNASQSKVHVNLVNQASYDDTWQKYQAGLSNGQLPDVVQLEDIDQQGAIDSRSILPVQSCIDASHYSTSDYVQRALAYWHTDGAQQAMPFSVSNPVVYYNKQSFTKAGLNPNDPPTTLPELMRDAAALKASGSGMGLKLDPWHLETWLATANQLFVNNGNGRTARATKAVFDGATARTIWSDLDRLVRSGDATTNPSTGTDEFDNLLGIGSGKYGMTIDSSADLGTVTSLLHSYPNVTLGIGPFPVLSSSIKGGVEPGGSALYICDKAPKAQQAAAWRFIEFLDSTQSQATWAAGTGYVPIRRSATATATIKNLWATTPGFKVAYQQLVSGATTNATAGAVIGPFPEVRTDVLNAEESMYQQGVSPAKALQNATRAVDATISQYNQSLGVG
jgi:sn-glycerol 3-phosphate transport system substrate-binding protein